MTPLETKLAEALEGVLLLYTTLVNSRDCGFWDPEKELPIIAARAALREKGCNEIT